MASTTSKAEEAPVIDMAAYGAKLAARRAELGEPVMARNGGAGRTESKRALLEAVDAAAKAKGFEW